MPQVGGGKSAKKTSSSTKRHFTVVMGNKEHGLYVSSNPSSAARKAVSKLCAMDKKRKVQFSIREITQGSKKKMYGPYVGKMKKLDKPIELKGRIIKYSTDVYLDKTKTAVKMGKKVGNKMRGGDVEFTGIITKNDFFEQKNRGLVFEKENRVSKEPYLFVGFINSEPYRYNFVAYNSGFGTYKRASFDKFTWNYELRNSMHEKDINIGIIPTQYLKDLIDYINFRRNPRNIQYKYMYCETIKYAIELEFENAIRISELKEIRELQEIRVNEERRRQLINYSELRQNTRSQHFQPTTKNIQKTKIKEFLMEQVKKYFYKYSIPDALFSEINFDDPVQKIINNSMSTLDIFLVNNPDAGNVDNILTYINMVDENKEIVETINNIVQSRVQSRIITSIPPIQRFPVNTQFLGQPLKLNEQIFPFGRGR